MDIVHHTTVQADTLSFSSSASTALAVHSDLRIMPAEGNLTVSGSTVTRPHSTVAAVDSLGNVTLALIPHSAMISTLNRPGPVPFRGAYAKIPPGSNSGTFRTLMLSSRAGVQTGPVPSPPSLCLALGCASVMVKVFAVTVVDSLTPAPPAFHLSLLYKVNTGFIPSYLLSLPLLPWIESLDGAMETDRETDRGREGEREDSVRWTPDILAVSTEGDMAYVSAHTAPHSPASLPLFATLSSTSTHLKGKKSDTGPLSKTQNQNQTQTQTQTLKPECITIRSAMSPLGPSPPYWSRICTVMLLAWLSAHKPDSLLSSTEGNSNYCTLKAEYRLYRVYRVCRVYREYCI